MPIHRGRVRLSTSIAACLLVALTMLALLGAPARAQVCPGRWLNSDGVAGVTYSMTTIPGGDIIVGGAFDGACSVSARNIARYSPATNTWSALGSGISDVAAAPIVYALATLPSGDVLVGGQFRTAGGVSASSIALYRPATGSWSALGAGINGVVFSLGVLSNGDVIVAGFFTSAGGVPANSIARWNPTTGVWSSIGSKTFSGGNRFVYSIAPLSGGDFAIGGDFTSISGTPAAFVARYTAASGAWSALGSGFNAWVNTVLALPSGEIYAGGVFTTSGATTVNRIARWNPAAGSWSALGVGVGTINSSGTVYSLAALPNSDIIVGGAFASAGGLFRIGIARFTPSTSTWNSLDLGLNNDGNSHLAATTAYALAPIGSDVIVGGRFEVAGLTRANGIARWNAGPATWSSLGSAVNGDVEAFALHPTGDIIAGGQFTAAGGIAANHIVRHNPSSNLWSPLADGLDNTVRAVAIFPSGNVVAGGEFTASGATPLARIGLWNAAAGAWLPLGSGTDDVVRALATAPNGDILAGGDFNAAGGAPAAHIARWDAATSSWSALGAGVNGPVRAILSLTGGDAIVGGAFTLAGGSPCSNIARWTATTSTWTPLGPGLNGRVNALVLLPGGDFVAGGEFTLAGATAVAHIARWNTATSAWTAMDNGTDNSVNALALSPSGAIIVGGAFDHISLGSSVLRVAIFDLSVPRWWGMNNGLDGNIRAIAAAPTGELFFGGTITRSINSAGPPLQTPAWARWTNTPIDSAQTVITAVAPYNATLDLRVNAIANYTGVTWQWLRNGVPVVNGPAGASPGGGIAGPPPIGTGFYGGASGVFPYVNPERGAYLYIYGARQSDAGVYSAALTSSCGTTVVTTYNITIRCPGDYDANGVFSVADIFSFISAWFSGSPQSFYHHGTSGQVADIFDFLAAWFAGC